jgi:hypothetical protein
MSSDLSTNQGTKTRPDESTWDAAILEAEREIIKTKNRLAGLRSAIRVFKDCKARGEAWPGTSGSAKEGFGSSGGFGAKPKM